MDNTMDINLRGDNSISNLSFIWTAKFNNLSDISQFNFETGEENRFQLVKDNFSNLEYFILWNKEKVFTVDLINGLIYFNKELMNKIDSIDKKENCRLIFFRRHQVELNQLGKEINHRIEYHLGFQHLKDGKNQKIILIIDEQGNWSLGD